MILHDNMEGKRYSKEKINIGMRWITIIFFIIISVSSGYANDIKTLENATIDSCIEYTSTTGDLYYCIMSELYGLKKVINIFRSDRTDAESAKLNELVEKYQFNENSYDWVSIETEYNDYWNNGVKK